MKLQHFLIGDRLAAGDYRGACNALLQHFGQSELPPSAEIKVNSITGSNSSRILVYIEEHWYEWGERHGFRHAAFANYLTDPRAVIWSKRVQ
jgi:hypothetical protein